MLLIINIICLIILQYGRTPLCWAAANGLTDVAQLLISKGASINVIDKVSSTDQIVIVLLM